MRITLDGPRLPPAAGGKPTSLVVLLHGYGSNGADLIALAPHWARLLPNTQFVSPNAPEPVPMAPGGYQWFAISRMDPRELERGVARGAPTVQAFLDRELERYGVPPERLALVGFSQGTMMALHVGLRRPGVAGIVGYSGALPAAGSLQAEAQGRTPVLLAHGDQDDMVPLGAMFDAAEGIAAAGLSAQWHISYGLPHSIGPDGLAIGGEFLRAALAGKLG
jgi:phospholipase/carboxylesterase